MEQRLPSEIRRMIEIQLQSAAVPRDCLIQMNPEGRKYLN